MCSARSSSEWFGFGELRTRQIPVKPAVHAEKVGIAGHEDKNGRPDSPCRRGEMRFHYLYIYIYIYIYIYAYMHTYIHTLTPRCIERVSLSVYLRRVIDIIAWRGAVSTCASLPSA